MEKQPHELSDKELQDAMVKIAANNIGSAPIIGFLRDLPMLRGLFGNQEKYKALHAEAERRGIIHSHSTSNI